MTRRNLFQAAIAALGGLALPWRKVETLVRYETAKVLQTVEWTNSDGTTLTADMHCNIPLVLTSHDGGKVWIVQSAGGV